MSRPWRRQKVGAFIKSNVAKQGLQGRLIADYALQVHQPCRLMQHGQTR